MTAQVSARFWMIIVVVAFSLMSGCREIDAVDDRFESGGFEAVAVVEGRPEPGPLVEAEPSVRKPGDRLRIGTWNIQWLDSEERGDKPAQRPEDLAEYIAASGVDVLGVMEIGARVVDGAWQNPTLNGVVDVLSGGTKGKWKYMLFPNARDDLRQLVGVVWNAERVQALGWTAAEIDRGKDPRIWHRHPVGVKFSAGRGLTDVVLIPVHMKCCLAAGQREEEARTLLAALPAMRSYFRDEDVIIMGDANLFDADEAAGRLYRRGGFTDLNVRDRPTHVQGFPFDRAYVRGEQPEFAGARMTVFGAEFMRPKGMDEKAFQERLSDHYLIWVDVGVRGDDD